jgi:ribosome-interacting GTPase 1
MLPVEDIAIQLIDLPSVSPEHPIPWIGNALQTADACLLVVDLGEPGCMEQVLVVIDILSERNVVLTAGWPADRVEPAGDDPFTMVLPTLMLANKADRSDDLDGELGVFRELTGLVFPVRAVSAETGEGLDLIGPWLLRQLEIVRVYTKLPGGPPDLGRPFTLRRGQTVQDVARLVHKDVAASLKYARLWGDGTFDGRRVGPEHQVEDGDVVEMHT